MFETGTTDVKRPAVIHRETTFRGVDGLELFRQQWRPDGDVPRAVLVNVHGIGDHSALYPALPDYFVPRGWAVHAFDLRGNGRSPGPRGHIHRWSELRGDLDSFLDAVRRDEGDRPLFLLGNSLGGLVVLDYASHHPTGLRGVIAVAPPLGRFGTPGWLLALGRVLSLVWPTFTLETGLDLSGLSRDDAVRAAILADPLFHRKGSARLAAEIVATAKAIHRSAAAFPVPLLLIHGGADRMVLPDGTRSFFGRAGQPDKEYLEYPGAYHAVFADLDRDRVLGDLGRWMESRLA
jgi:alpha-beta hydrolase superfamily lysophospholipase